MMLGRLVETIKIVKPAKVVMPAPSPVPVAEEKREKVSAK